MIYGLIHPGSGLGNQLHRYVAARVLALDKGYKFGMVAPENFKGKDFMKLDMGVKGNLALKDFKVEYPAGKIVFPEGWVWEEWDKHTYDPDINFVKEMTIIDGNFEDARYFEHRMSEIEEWLKTESADSLVIDDSTCVIGFRGGEYYTVPELGLPREYFERAVEEMLKINPNMNFQIHTDDKNLADQFFKGFEFKYVVGLIQDISINWRSMRYAKYAIIANSSFYILPRLLQHHNNKDAVTIAPRYFNRYNIKKWDYPQFYYKQFMYI